ncbi:MAG TPA: DUF4105 domain-containing protein, partial [Arenibacter sp.]|nr:DUF4105 domain-containing protein [Arenibacter sp.]
FLGMTAFCGAQVTELSPGSQISVLTCGSGSDLYTTFGHSAIRVQDPVQDLDMVYNYGTFNFDPPMFYVEFAMGNLYYSLSKQEMPYFLYAYELENRWVKEQVLNLNVTERNTLYSFLEKNYLPENRDYRYDFFYNNCATKIGDVLQEALGRKLVFDEGYLPEKFTFRELIHQNLTLNSWSSFGIDLALGSVIDIIATTREHMFLPRYVMQQLGHTTLNGTGLVRGEHTILDTRPQGARNLFLTSPLFWVSILTLFVLTITYRDQKKKVRSRFLDLALFTTTGLAGLVLLFLWFIADHTATVNNFNILWVFPFNLVISFVILRKVGIPAWLPRFMLLLMGMLVLTGILWVFKIQSFSPLVIPLLLMLGIRYLFLWKYFQQQIRLK